MLAERAVALYDELLSERFFESTREALLAASARKQTADGRVWCGVMRPLIIGERAYGEMQRDVELVWRALTRAADAVVSDEALRRQVGYPKHLEPIWQLDAGRGTHSLCGRFDGLLDVQGKQWLIEFNAEVNWARPNEVQSAFDRMPIARAFAERLPFRSVSQYEQAFRSLVATHRARGGTELPTVALVNANAEVDPAMLEWMANLTARGCTTRTASAGELSYQAGRLFAADTAVDFVLFVPWESVFAQTEVLRPALRAIAEGAAVAVHGVSRGVATGFKLIFEVLSDPAHAHLFEAAERQALAERIPWSRGLRERHTTYRGDTIDLLPFVAEHRDRFVLKPCGGKWGLGVVLGWERSEQDFRRAMERALRQQYIVQERVPMMTTRYPVLDGDGCTWADLAVDFDPYTWEGGRVDGGMVRLAREGVMNVAAGGAMTAVWILRDE